MIASEARDPETGAAPTYHFASAREAFRNLLGTLEGEPAPILLPAFIGESDHEGSGVLDPVRSLRLRPTFYKITSDIAVDLGDFTKQLTETRPSLVLLIQYYGRTDPGSESVARACRQAGILLVEDAAHGLFSALRTDSSLGTHGDVVIFSLHKMLPLSYGGMMRFRNPTLRHRCTSSRPELAAILFGYDMRSLGELRRRNFRRAIELLKNSPLYNTAYYLPWIDLGGDVPQSVPILVRHVNRNRLYFLLNEVGIGAVSLYHRLVDEIGESFPLSKNISRHIINLPVHQDLSLADIDRMIGLFLSTIGDLSLV